MCIYSTTNFTFIQNSLFIYSCLVSSAVIKDIPLDLTSTGITPGTPSSPKLQSNILSSTIPEKVSRIASITRQRSAMLDDQTLLPLTQTLPEAFITTTVIPTAAVSQIVYPSSSKSTDKELGSSNAGKNKYSTSIGITPGTPSSTILQINFLSSTIPEKVSRVASMTSQRSAMLDSQTLLPLTQTLPEAFITTTVIPTATDSRTVYSSSSKSTDKELGSSNARENKYSTTNVFTEAPSVVLESLLPTTNNHYAHSISQFNSPAISTFKLSGYTLQTKSILQESKEISLLQTRATALHISRSSLSLDGSWKSSSLHSPFTTSVKQDKSFLIDATSTDDSSMISDNSYAAVTNSMEPTSSSPLIVPPTLSTTNAFSLQRFSSMNVLHTISITKDTAIKTVRLLGTTIVATSKRQITNSFSSPVSRQIVMELYEQTVDTNLRSTSKLLVTTGTSQNKRLSRTLQSSSSSVKLTASSVPGLSPTIVGYVLKEKTIFTSTSLAITSTLTTTVLATTLQSASSTGLSKNVYSPLSITRTIRPYTQILYSKQLQTHSQSSITRHIAAAATISGLVSHSASTIMAEAVTAHAQSSSSAAASTTARNIDTFIISKMTEVKNQNRTSSSQAKFLSTSAYSKLSTNMIIEKSIMKSSSLLSSYSKSTVKPDTLNMLSIATTFVEDAISEVKMTPIIYSTPISISVYSLNVASSQLPRNNTKEFGTFQVSTVNTETVHSESTMLQSSTSTPMEQMAWENIKTETLSGLSTASEPTIPIGSSAKINTTFTITDNTREQPTSSRSSTSNIELSKDPLLSIYSERSVRQEARILLFSESSSYISSSNLNSLSATTNTKHLSLFYSKPESIQLSIFSSTPLKEKSTLSLPMVFTLHFKSKSLISSSSTSVTKLLLSNYNVKSSSIDNTNHSTDSNEMYPLISTITPSAKENAVLKSPFESYYSLLPTTNDLRDAISIYLVKITNVVSILTSSVEKISSSSSAKTSPKMQNTQILYRNQTQIHPYTSQLVKSPRTATFLTSSPGITSNCTSVVMAQIITPQLRTTLSAAVSTSVTVSSGFISTTGISPIGFNTFISSGMTAVKNRNTTLSSPTQEKDLSTSINSSFATIETAAKSHINSAVLLSSFANSLTKPESINPHLSVSTFGEGVLNGLRLSSATHSAPSRISVYSITDTSSHVTPQNVKNIGTSRFFTLSTEVVHLESTAFDATMLPLSASTLITPKATTNNRALSEINMRSQSMLSITSSAKVASTLTFKETLTAVLTSSGGTTRNIQLTGTLSSSSSDMSVKDESTMLSSAVITPYYYSYDKLISPSLTTSTNRLAPDLNSVERTLDKLSHFTSSGNIQLSTNSEKSVKIKGTVSLFTDFTSDALSGLPGLSSSTANAKRLSSESGFQENRLDTTNHLSDSQVPHPLTSTLTSIGQESLVLKSSFEDNLLSLPTAVTATDTAFPPLVTVKHIVSIYLSSDVTSSSSSAAKASPKMQNTQIWYRNQTQIHPYTSQLVNSPRTAAFLTSSPGITSHSTSVVMAQIITPQLRTTLSAAVSTSVTVSSGFISTTGISPIGFNTFISSGMTAVKNRNTTLSSPTQEKDLSTSINSSFATIETAAKSHINSAVLLSSFANSLTKPESINPHSSVSTFGEGVLNGLRLSSATHSAPSQISVYSITDTSFSTEVVYLESSAFDETMSQFAKSTPTTRRATTNNKELSEIKTASKSMLLITSSTQVAATVAFRESLTAMLTSSRGTAGALSNISSDMSVKEEATMLSSVAITKYFYSYDKLISHSSTTSTSRLASDFSRVESTLDKPNRFTESYNQMSIYPEMSAKRKPTISLSSVFTLNVPSRLLDSLSSTANAKWLPSDYGSKKSRLENLTGSQVMYSLISTFTQTGEESSILKSSFTNNFSSSPTTVTAKETLSFPLISMKHFVSIYPPSRVVSSSPTVAKTSHKVQQQQTVYGKQSETQTQPYTAQLVNSTHDSVVAVASPGITGSFTSTGISKTFTPQLYSISVASVSLYIVDTTLRTDTGSNSFINSETTETGNTNVYSKTQLTSVSKSIAMYSTFATSKTTWKSHVNSTSLPSSLPLLKPDTVELLSTASTFSEDVVSELKISSEIQRTPISNSLFSLTSTPNQLIRNVTNDFGTSRVSATGIATGYLELTVIQSMVSQSSTSVPVKRQTIISNKTDLLSEITTSASTPPNVSRIKSNATAQFLNPIKKTLASFNNIDFSENTLLHISSKTSVKQELTTSSSPEIFSYFNSGSLTSSLSKSSTKRLSPDYSIEKSTLEKAKSLTGFEGTQLSISSEKSVIKERALSMHSVVTLNLYSGSLTSPLTTTTTTKTSSNLLSSEYSFKPNNPDETNGVTSFQSVYPLISTLKPTREDISYIDSKHFLFIDPSSSVTSLPTIATSTSEMPFTHAVHETQTQTQSYTAQLVNSSRVSTVSMASPGITEYFAFTGTSKTSTPRLQSKSATSAVVQFPDDIEGTSLRTAAGSNSFTISGVAELTASSSKVIASSRIVSNTTLQFANLIRKTSTSSNNIDYSENALLHISSKKPVKQELTTSSSPDIISYFSSENLISSLSKSSTKRLSPAYSLERSTVEKAKPSTGFEGTQLSINQEKSVKKEPTLSMPIFVTFNLYSASLTSPLATTTTSSNLLSTDYSFKTNKLDETNGVTNFESAYPLISTSKPAREAISYIESKHVFSIHPSLRVTSPQAIATSTSETLYIHAVYKTQTQRHTYTAELANNPRGAVVAMTSLGVTKSFAFTGTSKTFSPKLQSKSTASALVRFTDDIKNTTLGTVADSNSFTSSGMVKYTGSSIALKSLISSSSKSSTKGLSPNYSIKDRTVRKTEHLTEFEVSHLRISSSNFVKEELSVPTFKPLSYFGSLTLSSSTASAKWLLPYHSMKTFRIDELNFSTDSLIAYSLISIFLPSKREHPILKSSFDNVYSSLTSKIAVRDAFSVSLVTTTQMFAIYPSSSIKAYASTSSAYKTSLKMLYTQTAYENNNQTEVQPNAFKVVNNTSSSASTASPGATNHSTSVSMGQVTTSQLQSTPAVLKTSQYIDTTVLKTATASNLFSNTVTTEGENRNLSVSLKTQQKGIPISLYSTYLKNTTLAKPQLKTPVFLSSYSKPTTKQGSKTAFSASSLSAGNVVSDLRLLPKIHSTPLPPSLSSPTSSLSNFSGHFWAFKLQTSSTPTDQLLATESRALSETETVKESTIPMSWNSNPSVGEVITYNSISTLTPSTYETKNSNLPKATQLYIASNKLLKEESKYLLTTVFPSHLYPESLNLPSSTKNSKGLSPNRIDETEQLMISKDTKLPISSTFLLQEQSIINTVSSILAPQTHYIPSLPSSSTISPSSSAIEASFKMPNTQIVSKSQTQTQTEPYTTHLVHSSRLEIVPTLSSVVKNLFTSTIMAQIVASKPQSTAALVMSQHTGNTTLNTATDSNIFISSTRTEFTNENIRVSSETHERSKLESGVSNTSRKMTSRGLSESVNVDGTGASTTSTVYFSASVLARFQMMSSGGSLNLGLQSPFIDAAMITYLPGSELSGLTESQSTISSRLKLSKVSVSHLTSDLGDARASVIDKLDSAFSPDIHERLPLTQTLVIKPESKSNKYLGTPVMDTRPIILSTAVPSYNFSKDLLVTDFDSFRLSSVKIIPSSDTATIRKTSKRSENAASTAVLSTNDSIPLVSTNTVNTFGKLSETQIKLSSNMPIDKVKASLSSSEGSRFPYSHSLSSLTFQSIKTVHVFSQPSYETRSYARHSSSSLNTVHNDTAQNVAPTISSMSTKRQITPHTINSAITSPSKFSYKEQATRPHVTVSTANLRKIAKPNDTSIRLPVFSSVQTPSLYSQSLSKPSKSSFLMLATTDISTTKNLVTPASALLSLVPYETFSFKFESLYSSPVTGKQNTLSNIQINLDLTAISLSLSVSSTQLTTKRNRYGSSQFSLFSSPVLIKRTLNSDLKIPGTVRASSTASSLKPVAFPSNTRSSFLTEKPVIRVSSAMLPSFVSARLESQVNEEAVKSLYHYISPHKTLQSTNSFASTEILLRSLSSPFWTIASNDYKFWPSQTTILHQRQSQNNDTTSSHYNEVVTVRLFSSHGKNLLPPLLQSTSSTKSTDFKGSSYIQKPKKTRWTKSKLLATTLVIASDFSRHIWFETSISPSVMVREEWLPHTQSPGDIDNILPQENTIDTRTLSISSRRVPSTMLTTLPIESVLFTSEKTNFSTTLGTSQAISSLDIKSLDPSTSIYTSLLVLSELLPGTVLTSLSMESLFISEEANLKTAMSISGTANGFEVNHRYSNSTYLLDKVTISRTPSMLLQPLSRKTYKLSLYTRRSTVLKQQPAVTGEASSKAIKLLTTSSLFSRSIEIRPEENLRSSTSITTLQATSQENKLFPSPMSAISEKTTQSWPSSTPLLFSLSVWPSEYITLQKPSMGNVEVFSQSKDTTPKVTANPSTNKRLPIMPSIAILSSLPLSEKTNVKQSFSTDLLEITPTNTSQDKTFLTSESTEAKDVSVTEWMKTILSPSSSWPVLSVSLQENPLSVLSIIIKEGKTFASDSSINAIHSTMQLLTTLRETVLAVTQSTLRLPSLIIQTHETTLHVLTTAVISRNLYGDNALNLPSSSLTSNALIGKSQTPLLTVSSLNQIAAKSFYESSTFADTHFVKYENDSTHSSEPTSPAYTLRSKTMKMTLFKLSPSPPSSDMKLETYSHKDETAGIFSNRGDIFTTPVLNDNVEGTVAVTASLLSSDVKSFAPKSMPTDNSNNIYKIKSTAGSTKLFTTRHKHIGRTTSLPTLLSSSFHLTSDTAIYGKFSNTAQATTAVRSSPIQVGQNDNTSATKQPMSSPFHPLLPVLLTTLEEEKRLNSSYVGTTQENKMLTSSSYTRVQLQLHKQVAYSVGESFSKRSTLIGVFNTLVPETSDLVQLSVLPSSSLKVSTKGNVSSYKQFSSNLTQNFNNNITSNPFTSSVAPSAVLSSSIKRAPSSLLHLNLPKSPDSITYDRTPYYSLNAVEQFATTVKQNDRRNSEIQMLRSESLSTSKFLGTRLETLYAEPTSDTLHGSIHSSTIDKSTASKHVNKIYKSTPLLTSLSLPKTVQLEVSSFTNLKIGNVKGISYDNALDTSSQLIGKKETITSKSLKAVATLSFESTLLTSVEPYLSTSLSRQKFTLYDNSSSHMNTLLKPILIATNATLPYPSVEETPSLQLVSLSPTILASNSKVTTGSFHLDTSDALTAAISAFEWEWFETVKLLPLSSLAMSPFLIKSSADSGTEVLMDIPMKTSPLLVNADTSQTERKVEVPILSFSSRSLLENLDFVTSMLKQSFTGTLRNQFQQNKMETSTSLNKYSSSTLSRSVSPTLMSVDTKFASTTNLHPSYTIMQYKSSTTVVVTVSEVAKPVSNNSISNMVSSLDKSASLDALKMYSGKKINTTPTALLQPRTVDLTTRTTSFTPLSSRTVTALPQEDTLRESSSLEVDKWLSYDSLETKLSDFSLSLSTSLSSESLISSGLSPVSIYNSFKHSSLVIPTQPVEFKTLSNMRVQKMSVLSSSISELTTRSLFNQPAYRSLQNSGNKTLTNEHLEEDKTLPISPIATLTSGPRSLYIVMTTNISRYFSPEPVADVIDGSRTTSKIPLRETLSLLLSTPVIKLTETLLITHSGSSINVSRVEALRTSTASVDTTLTMKKKLTKTVPISSFSSYVTMNSVTALYTRLSSNNIHFYSNVMVTVLPIGSATTAVLSSSRALTYVPKYSESIWQTPSSTKIIPGRSKDTMSQSFSLISTASSISKKLVTSTFPSAELLTNVTSKYEMSSRASLYNSSLQDEPQTKKSKTATLIFTTKVSENLHLQTTVPSISPSSLRGFKALQAQTSIDSTSVHSRVNDLNALAFSSSSISKTFESLLPTYSLGDTFQKETHRISTPLESLRQPRYNSLPLSSELPSTFATEEHKASQSILESTRPTILDLLSSLLNADPRLSNGQHSMAPMSSTLVWTEEVKASQATRQYSKFTPVISLTSSQYTLATSSSPLSSPSLSPLMSSSSSSPLSPSSSSSSLSLSPSLSSSPISSSSLTSSLLPSSEPSSPLSSSPSLTSTSLSKSIELAVEENEHSFSKSPFSNNRLSSEKLNTVETLRKLSGAKTVETTLTSNISPLRVTDTFARKETSVSPTQQEVVSTQTSISESINSTNAYQLHLVEPSHVSISQVSKIVNDLVTQEQLSHVGFISSVDRVVSHGTSLLNALQRSWDYLVVESMGQTAASQLRLQAFTLNSRVVTKTASGSSSVITSPILEHRIYSTILSPFLSRSPVTTSNILATTKLTTSGFQNVEILSSQKTATGEKKRTRISTLLDSLQRPSSKSSSLLSEDYKMTRSTWPTNTRSNPILSNSPDLSTILVVTETIAMSASVDIVSVAERSTNGLLDSFSGDKTSNRQSLLLTTRSLLEGTTLSSSQQQLFSSKAIRSEGIEDANTTSH